MPVALVFDAASVLSIPGTRFSDHNLAIWSSLNAIQRPWAGIEAIKKLPFRYIYHSAALYSDDPFRDVIKRHKNAEVIVPDRLGLEGALVAVRTRSDAELDTLRTLLPPDIWSRFRGITGTNNDGTLFFTDRYFIERVWLVDGAIYITVHRPSKHLDRDEEFQATLRVDYIATNVDPIVTTFPLAAGRGPTIHTKTGFVDSRQNVAKITLFLDGNLAYQGTHWLSDEPVIYPSRE
jgi:hypothetical protein